VAAINGRDCKQDLFSQSAISILQQTEHLLPKNFLYKDIKKRVTQDKSSYNSYLDTEDEDWEATFDYVENNDT
jgi:hypothetical protein